MAGLSVTAPGDLRPDTPAGAGLRAALGRAGLPEQIRHVTELPARQARHTDWPADAPEGLVRAFAARGVERPWLHQVRAAALAGAGTHTVLATGTASGKSLGYQLAVGTRLAADPRATALYLAPTKALAADQLTSWRALERDGAGGAQRLDARDSYDGHGLEQPPLGHGEPVDAPRDHRAQRGR